jgi:poly(3-hydroxybutyrate) depolymerase
MLYQAYQVQTDLLSPLRLFTQWLSSALWFDQTEGTPIRRLAAGSEVLSRLRLTHARPPYAIADVQVGNDLYPVVEETTVSTPFGQLLHFRKPGAPWQPPVMLVAPCRATLPPCCAKPPARCCKTTTCTSQTGTTPATWACNMADFGLDEYIDTLMLFTEAVTAQSGARAHWVAVCQPCVAALAATALMAEDDRPDQPQSLTLMAGPVDCRINPTEVNKLAVSKPIDWFDRNLVSAVPLPHKGFMRRVYPGFLQLTAFISMNPERHKQSFKDMYRHLVDGEIDKADVIREFYDEYLAVNDLPAEFYLETVEKVFQTYDLPRGVLQYKDRTVNTAAIRRTALLTVEGERDDICAVGQTVAAQDMCPSIRPYLKTHHVQTGVGHYGVFSAAVGTSRFTRVCAT